MKRSLALVAISAASLFTAIAIAGAWPEAAPAGIPDAGVVVWWLAIGLRALADLSSIATTGLLFYLLFVVADHKGALGTSKVRSWIETGTWLWLVGALARIFVGLADELGVPLSQALDPVVVRSYLTQTSVGRYLTAQLILIALLVPMTSLMKRWFTGFFAFIVGAIALILPALTGHSAGSGNHSLALGSISIHLWAVAAWVGVVAGYFADRSRLQRVSSVAFGSVAVIAVTGIVNAVIRFTSLSDINSDYGRVLLLKIALLMIVIAVGYRARRQPRIGFEIAMMTAIITISAALSRLQPPIPRDVEAATAVQELTGAPMPSAPTLGRLLTTWSLDGFSLALSIAMVLAYVAGVRALRRRGDSWPVVRVINFMLGVAAFLYASNGGLAAYAKVAFSFHMIAHMVIVTLAPIGIVLGAPITLALRTLPQGQGDEEGLRGHLQRALNSKPVKLVSHPLWALLVFDASLFGLYFTGIFADLMRWHVGHALMDIHFLAVGLLFFYVIVGIDPNPHRTPYIVRIVLLLAAMSLHAFFSISVMSTTSLLDGGYYESLQRPWFTDLLDDQHTGGSIGWALGEVPIVLGLIATFIQWVRADDREQRRIDRAADRAEASGEDDELAAYNAYLQQLAEQDRDR